MGDIGPSEIMIIVVIALVLFGSTRLPAMAKGVGGAIREFKKELRSDTVEPAAEQPVTVEPATVEPAVNEVREPAAS